MIILRIIKIYGFRINYGILPRRILFSFLFLCHLCNIGVNDLYAADDSLEYKIKAAYLYNFTKFIDWPQREGGVDTLPIKICVLGNDPFGKLIDPIETKISKGRAIRLQRIRNIDNVSNCHIVFISRSESNRLEQILLEAGDSGILTVSDTEEFAKNGGIIGFIIKDDRIRLEINITAASKAGLKVSAKLLEISRIVRTGEQGLKQ